MSRAELFRAIDLDAEYFWKFTDGAYDFNVILNTPLNFPVQFRKAKIDGSMVRMNLAPVRGFTVFTVTYDPDGNPSRITPRHLFDVGLGADSLCKKDSLSFGAQLAIVNLANKSALYNFLSSFSGTHFVSPRSIQGGLVLHF